MFEDVRIKVQIWVLFNSDNNLKVDFEDRKLFIKIYYWLLIVIVILLLFKKIYIYNIINILLNN